MTCSFEALQTPAIQIDAMTLLSKHTLANFTIVETMAVELRINESID